MNSCLSISKRRQVVSWKIEFFLGFYKATPFSKACLICQQSQHNLFVTEATQYCVHGRLWQIKGSLADVNATYVQFTLQRSKICSKTWTRLVSDHPILSCFWPVWNSQTWFLAVDIFIPISITRIADTNDQCIYDLFFDTYLFSTCWE